MVAAHRRRWLVPSVLGILVFICDQVSKYWILQNLGPHPGMRVIPVIGDWFNIVYSQNTGVAFGLFRNMSPLFIVVSLVICAGAIYVYNVYLPNDTWTVQLSLGLIVGGALGNVVDRINHGFVVDFIQVGWWPVFNLADSSISVGATVLALHLLFTNDEPVELAEPQDDALLRELLHRDMSVLERDQSQNPHG